MTSNANRVVWSEGLFLQPHHLQQQERWIERLLQLKTRPLRLFPWGIESLELDTGLLAGGAVAVVSAQGTLPDGAPFQMPERDPVPAPIQIDQTVKNHTVYLAAPLNLSGETQVALAPELAPPGTRYHAEDAVVRDVNTGERTEATLRVARLRSRLMLEGEARDGYASMGIARVAECRSDGSVTLDKDYIAPCLDIRSSTLLREWLEQILSELRRRGDQLGRLVGQPTAGDVTSFGGFIYLLSVNRLEPLVAHLNTLTGLHPEDLYRALLSIAGELSTFIEARRPPDLPAYRHDDLATCFPPVVHFLLEVLRRPPPVPVIEIEIQDRPQSYKVAFIKDRTLLTEALFVLTAKANMDHESLRKKVPDQIKVGTVDQIKEFVAHATSGIDLLPMLVPPRELRPDPDTAYFELDRRSRYWKDMEQSDAFGLHIGGNLPELELRLWAILR